jgi:hypothetical protein
MAHPSPEHQIEFLSQMQRLLSEGLFVAAYKYALLMALADLCVEQGQDDDGSLQISTQRSNGELFQQRPIDPL